MKKILVLLLTLVMCFAVFTSCTEVEEDVKQPETPATEDDKYGGVVNIALGSSPKNLDPIFYTGTYEGNVIRNIADTLVAYKHDLSAIVPNIATEWYLMKLVTRIRLN